MADFSLAILVVLQHEGGAIYTDDPQDPGGGTKYGISHKSYPDLDIRNLKLEQAEDIYRHDFWNPLRLDEVQNQTLATKILDTCVNMGCTTGIKLLQQALNDQGSHLVCDGTIGDLTLAAIKNCSAPDALLAGYKRLLVDHYLGLVASNAALRKYQKGWLNRADWPPASDAAGQNA